jgi:hypothetical protein
LLLTLSSHSFADEVFIDAFRLHFHYADRAITLPPLPPLFSSLFAIIAHRLPPPPDYAFKIDGHYFRCALLPRASARARLRDIMSGVKCAKGAARERARGAMSCCAMRAAPCRDICARREARRRRQICFMLPALARLIDCLHPTRSSARQRSLLAFFAFDASDAAFMIIALLLATLTPLPLRHAAIIFSCCQRDALFSAPAPLRGQIRHYTLPRAPLFRAAAMAGYRPAAAPDIFTLPPWLIFFISWLRQLSPFRQRRRTELIRDVSIVFRHDASASWLRFFSRDERQRLFRCHTPRQMPLIAPSPPITPFSFRRQLIRRCHYAITPCRHYAARLLPFSLTPLPVRQLFIKYYC